MVLLVETKQYPTKDLVMRLSYVFGFLLIGGE